MSVQEHEGSLLRFEVERGDEGQRVDAWLASKVEDLSRSFVRKLVDGGQVCLVVDGQELPIKPSYKVRAHDVIEMQVPPPEPCEAEPEDIPVPIVYEDGQLLVINKPRGLVVHPAPGNYTGTLVNALLHHCSDLSGVGGVARPGIVHRLDKDTSGLMVVAKTNEAHLSLSRQIKAREAKREYLAIVHGVVSLDRGRIDAPIGRHPVHRKKMAVVSHGGKPAVTNFFVVERFRRHTLVRCALETGRTHQIRVHMAYIGHPVVGDPVYGHRNSEFDIDGQALHAAFLRFRHPSTGEPMEFTVEIPEDMERILSILR